MESDVPLKQDSSCCFYAAHPHTQMLSISNQAHQSLSLHGGGSLPGLHTPTSLHWNEERNLFTTWSQEYVGFISGTSCRFCLFLNCHTHILYFKMMCAFPIIACPEKRQTVCRLRVFLYGGYSRACVSVCAQDVSKWWATPDVFEPHEADVAERSSHYTVPGFQPLFSFTLPSSEETVVCGRARSRMLPREKKKKKKSGHQRQTWAGTHLGPNPSYPACMRRRRG